MRIALGQINTTNVQNLRLAWAWGMNPGVQEPEPLVHDGTPLCVLHAIPQPPQLSGVVCVSTSQPLAGSASQSSHGGVQPERTQTPPAHVVAAFGASHGEPQAPQFDEDV